MGARIGLINPDTNEVESIYLDKFYKPEELGLTLCEEYKDIAKINQLVSLGDLSMLGRVPSVATCLSDLMDYDFCVSLKGGKKTNIVKDIDTYIHKFKSSNEYLYYFDVNNLIWRVFVCESGENVEL